MGATGEAPIVDVLELAEDRPVVVIPVHDVGVAWLERHERLGAAAADQAEALFIGLKLFELERGSGLDAPQVAIPLLGEGEQLLGMGPRLGSDFHDRSCACGLQARSNQFAKLDERMQ